MFARFRAADHELSAKELFVMQFRHGALRFVYRQHLHEGETFRALIVFVSHDLGVLHLPNTVEELKQIALRRVEGQIADVKPRRCDFD